MSKTIYLSKTFKYSFIKLDAVLVSGTAIEDYMLYQNAFRTSLNY